MDKEKKEINVNVNIDMGVDTIVCIGLIIAILKIFVF